MRLNDPVVLPTNVLVRLLVNDDPEQARRAAACSDTSSACFGPITVVLELEWVLRGAYKLPRDSVLQAFEGLLAIRLFAQTARFLQLHPMVQHLAVVVLVPHRRLNLGPALLPLQLQAFVDGVLWLSLEELSLQAGLDPLLALLTLPVRPEAELQASSQQILARRPDLLSAVQTILLERLPLLTREELMEFATIPAKDLRHTRVAQEWIEEGRQEGRIEGRQEGEACGRAAEAAVVTLRQLNRRCGPLHSATTARIQALPLERLEVLAEALLDFNGPADLAAWLAEHGG